MKARKNSKPFYYLRAYSLLLWPKCILRRIRKKKLTSARFSPEYDYLMERVNYYCKLEGTQLPPNAPELGKHTISNKRGQSVYFFDSYEYTRYFPDRLKWFLKGGDVTTIPPHPTIVKSRPIKGDNANSVLLKMDKVRHFFFVEDTIPFEKKAAKALFRGYIHGKPNRQLFIEKFIDNPMCDVRDTAPHSTNPKEWQAKNMSIAKHLDYRYIMALEGNDVASNLKWIMSSNSIAVMPRPTYETWYMEGKLIPNYHYIEIKPDFSDLTERLEYYNNHIDEAKEIIKNANKYAQQFRDKKRESLISLMVLEKYFKKTGQKID